ncbi:MAG TPA: Crp/Fnr family transcriptional regulator [Pseudogracilibacillus sp.]|nr:Crp/Fnr family transcriptional regulator [Pseudogracilibacillus sp.]
MILAIKNNCLDKILNTGERKFYRKGECIYRQDEVCQDTFYFLVKGLVKISCVDQRGGEAIIDIVSPNNIFGEQAANGTTYFSTAEAYENSVVYSLSVHKARKLIESDHEFRMFIYNGLREKLKLLSKRLVIQSLPSETILATALIELQEKMGQNPFPMMQKDLCKYTTLNRTTIYNIVKKWQDHLIRIHNQEIHILDFIQLKKISNM